MKTKTWQEIRAKGRTPEQLAAIDADVAEEAKRIMSEPIYLEAIEALANAATPGPWIAVLPRSQEGGAAVAHAGPTWAHSFPDPTSIRVKDNVTVRPVEDAAYIAAMHPQTALSLIAAVRERDAEIERLRDLLEVREDGERKWRARAQRAEALLEPVQDAARARQTAHEMRRSAMGARIDTWESACLGAADADKVLVARALATIADEKPAPVDSEA